MPVRANIFFDMFPFCILFEVPMRWFNVIYYDYPISFRKTWLSKMLEVLWDFVFHNRLAKRLENSGNWSNLWLTLSMRWVKVSILDIENTCIQFIYPFCAYTLLFVICALQYCACTVCVCVELDSWFLPKVLWRLTGSVCNCPFSSSSISL